ncbi:unnamed protein product [Rotaria sp. Silwood2]|nr:unnamed protein product [Rotaria sp. Silwood2]
MSQIEDKNYERSDDDNEDLDENVAIKGNLSDERIGTVKVFIESKRLLQNNIKADENNNVDEDENNNVDEDEN